jgi:hypothetical protein
MSEAATRTVQNRNLEHARLGENAVWLGVRPLGQEFSHIVGSGHGTRPNPNLGQWRHFTTPRLLFLRCYGI